MKIANINNSINFQKKLVAKATIGEKSNPQNVKIYLLDKQEDERVFAKMEKDKNWENNFYLDKVHCWFNTNDWDNYVMENEDGDVINYAAVETDFYHDANALARFETAPAYSSNQDDKVNKDRRYKYAGETMLAYLAKKSYKQGKSLYVPSVESDSNASDFYFNQCGFFKCYTEELEARMLTFQIRNFVEKNEQHTGHKIQYLG